MILPRTLKGAVAPNPDPRGDDSDPEMELISLSTVQEVKCFLVLWHLLALDSPVKVPGPSSYTIRIHRRSEHHKHVLHAFDFDTNIS